MALLYMDGFDLQDTLIRWTTIGYTGSVVYTTATRLGAGKCVTLDVGPAGGAGTTIQIVRPITPSAQVYVGAAIQTTLEGGNTNNPTANFFGLCGDNGATGHLYLHRTTSNSIQLCRADPAGGSVQFPQGSGVVLATSAVGTLDGNWHYVEMSATIHDSTGSVTVKVDGATVLTFTGDTRNGGTSTDIDTVKFKTGRYVDTPSAMISIDDLYICNGTGTVNNTFLGDVRVQSLLPNGAGASTQLAVTGAANNHTAAGESPYNNATYNSSATVGQRDTYALSDLAAGTAGVLGVQAVAHMQKSPDAGTASAKVAIKSGATVYYDATRSLGTAVAAYSQVRETDPATSAAWTLAAVNALEAGMEVA
jgi:hypothetical protein